MNLPGSRTATHRPIRQERDVTATHPTIEGTGRCGGCGTVRRLGTACTTADCPRFVPIHLRTAADHEVHQ